MSATRQRSRPGSATPSVDAGRELRAGPEFGARSQTQVIILGPVIHAAGKLATHTEAVDHFTDDQFVGKFFGAALLRSETGCNSETTLMLFPTNGTTLVPQIRNNVTGGIYTA